MSRRRRERGFTLIELAVCVTIMALVTPALYIMVRSFGAQHRKVLADVHAAEGMRTLSESLRRDLFAMRLDEGSPGLVLVGDGDCKHLTYAIDPQGVLRRAGEVGCGPGRALAAGVSRIDRRGGLVNVTFVRRVSAGEHHETTLAMGLVAGGTP